MTYNQFHIQNVMRIFKEKEWDFPKNHQLIHLFGDIRQKGSTSYLSCNVGEGFHQGLIQAYQSSNKKNSAYQVGPCDPFQLYITYTLADSSSRES